MKQTVFAMIAAASLFIGATSCSQQPLAKDQTTVPAEFTIRKEKLMDKIKGGWAGQTIGCTYGGPTEFKYNGTIFKNTYRSYGRTGISNGGTRMCPDCTMMFIWTLHS